MKAKRLSKAKRLLSLDRITTLPQPIIETILCLLPIEEAARTSILSKQWRYKWTSIPKLEFDQLKLMNKRQERRVTIKLLSVVLRVLLLRQDPIQEFALSLDNWDEDNDYTQTDIDIILLQLSRNHTIKCLTLNLTTYSHFTFPLFICNGFGSLTSLSLVNVNIQGKPLVELLSNCPLLKTLNLSLHCSNLPCLEPLTMVELFECLPVIEHLTIFGDTARFFVPDLVRQQFPTSLLIHLKYVRLEYTSFVDGYELTFLAVLIKCSPNLEKIEIEFEDFGYFETQTDILKEYSDVWLEHLMEVEIKNYRNMKAELEFVKFILARSPKLKKMSIVGVINKDEQSVILHTPRASPVVEINVKEDDHPVLYC